MTTAQLLAIRTKALAMAESRSCFPTMAGYAARLRHVARDCDYAAEGCEESLNSVLAFLATDHELDLALYPDDGVALAPVQSTIGMGIAA